MTEPSARELFHEESERRAARRHKLDSPDMKALHTDLIGHYHRELERQSANRKRMEQDEDIYDHEQWSPEDVAVLEERGQMPLVFNVTQTAINWVLGSERKAPMDYKILPRRKAGLKAAQRKTELMKYLSDVNHSPMHVSRAFAECVKAGLSWLETGVQEDDEGERVYDRYESWRNILADSTAQELDFSDGRYLFRTKWVDVDRAQAMFPDRLGVIIAATDFVIDPSNYADGLTGDSAMDSQEEQAFEGMTSHYEHGSVRRRVRLYECWYRKPVPTKVMRGGDFSGEIFDPSSPGHAADVAEERAEIVSRPRERMHVAIMTDRGILWQGPSPYRHNRYPFTPLWGYRRAKNGQPYGMIRGIRDIQIDLNKRASKALWHATAKRALVQKGSVLDIEEFREELHRPDAVIEYEQGKAAPVIENDLQAAAAQENMMSRDIQMIQQTSGVTDENMGRDTNATSGKAIIARQEQGQLSTGHFFENLRFARKIHGEKILVNIEQFYTEEKQFRITNQRGNPEYVTINDPTDPEEDWITRTKADFIVTEDSYRASQRQAQAEALIELTGMIAQGNPQFAMAIADLLVEMLDIPKGEEIVKRIRQITGQADPDADPNNPDPETLARQEAAAEQADMQKRAQEAEIGEKEAKAEETRAKARKALADAAKAEGGKESEQIANLRAALEAAGIVVGTPGIGAVADVILQEAAARTEGAGAMQAPEAPAALPAPEPQQPQPAPQGAY